MKDRNGIEVQVGDRVMIVVRDPWERGDFVTIISINDFDNLVTVRHARVAFPYVTYPSWFVLPIAAAIVRAREKGVVKCPT